MRIAQRRKCAVRIEWVSVNSADEDEVQRMLNAAAERISQAIKNIHVTDLNHIVSDDFVVIGTKPLEQMNLVSALNDQRRCLVVVQGSSESIPRLAASTHKAALTF
jgi:hypothetical protein